jgi:hypothetical protein
MRLLLFCLTILLSWRMFRSGVKKTPLPNPPEKEPPYLPPPNPKADNDVSFPNAAEANIRVVCNEIADQLSKNWRFKLQVIGIVVLAFLSLAAAVGTIVGWSISTSLANERQRFEDEVRRQISTAREATEKQIGEEFKKENVKKTVETAAADQASKLLTASVEPSIQSFQSKLDATNGDIDRRFAEFSELVKKSEQAASSNLEDLRHELARLQTRNNLTALADKAISEGDVASYRKLEELSAAESSPEEKNAAISELFRVYQQFSLFSGVSRTGNIHIVASAVNSKKTKEEELEVEELLPLLKEEDQPLGRAKVAELIRGKAKQGSFRTADALATALAKETNLEAFKMIGSALARTVNHDVGDELDYRGLLQWFDENKNRLKTEDTDATPSPTPSAIKTP